MSKLITDPKHYKYLAFAMKRVIIYNDENVKDELSEFLSYCSDEWLEVIENEFKDWTDPDHPEMYLRNASPFLGKIPYETLVEIPDEDELPF